MMVDVLKDNPVSIVHGSQPRSRLTAKARNDFLINSISTISIVKPFFKVPIFTTSSQQKPDDFQGENINVDIC